MEILDEEALAAWREVPREFTPSIVGALTAWTLFQLGQEAEAYAEIEESVRTDPSDTGGMLAGMKAMMLAAAGKPQEAEQEIKSAIGKKGYGHFHHTAYFLASTYLRMKKPEPGFLRCGGRG